MLVLPTEATEPVFLKAGFIYPPADCQSQSPRHQPDSNNLPLIKINDCFQHFLTGDK